jgi:hypothetical protein
MMNERTVIDDLKRVIFEETQSDTVGLWAVLWQVKHAMPSLNPDEARRVTLQLIHEVLLGQQVVPGEFIDQDEITATFASWTLPADKVIERIEREWKVLGSEPHLGDIVCFVDRRLLPVMALKDPMGKDWNPRQK